MFVVRLNTSLYSDILLNTFGIEVAPNCSPADLVGENNPLLCVHSCEAALTLNSIFRLIVDILSPWPGELPWRCVFVSHAR